MNDWWFRALAERILRYLDQVDRLVGQDAGPRDLELRRLAGAWRALLRVHAPTRRRHCGVCGQRCARHRREPLCTVWWVANAYFIRRLHFVEPPDSADASVPRRAPRGCSRREE